MNPAFGRASVMVGGADADALFDDVLIDIKPVKQASFTRKMFDQLLGDYTLPIIGGIGEKKPKPTIWQIGIYFSRHTHLHVVDVDEVINRSTCPDSVEWFATHALEHRFG